MCTAVASTGDSTLKCMRRAFVVSNLTMLTPFQWLPSQITPRRISSPWQIFVWSFHFIMILVYCIHLTLRSWITYHEEAIQEWKKLYVQFLTIHMSLCAWLQMGNYWNRDVLPAFMGRYIKCFQSSKVNTLLSDRRNGFLTKNEQSFVKGLRYALYGNALLLGLVCLVRPDTPDLWVAWLQNPNDTHITWLDILPWTPIQFYYGLSYTNCGAVYSCCNFSFVFPTINVLKHMQSLLACGDPGFNNVMMRVRQGNLEDKRLLSIYRQLYLLVQKYNIVFGNITMATKVTFIASAVFCTYGALRLEGILAGFLGFLGLTIMIFFAAWIVTLGEVNSLSKIFLWKIKSRYAYRPMYGEHAMHSLWLKKCFKSTQELKIRAGSTYFFDKGVALTTFKITLDNTINFLLASK